MYGLEKYRVDNEAVLAAKAARLDKLVSAKVDCVAAENAYLSAQNMDSSGANAVIGAAYDKMLAAYVAMDNLLKAELEMRGLA